VEEFVMVEEWWRKCWLWRKLWRRRKESHVNGKERERKEKSLWNFFVEFCKK
jgi:hypothetical protein